MDKNSLWKKVLALLFLIVILGLVFVFQDSSLKSSDYFSWIKDKLIGIGPELNLTKDSPDLDLSNINLEDFLDERPDSSSQDGEKQESSRVVEEDVLIVEDVLEEKVITDTLEYGIGGPVPGVSTSSTLENNLLKISEELERISDSVNNLILLSEIQNSVDSISRQIEQINQEISRI